MTKIAEELDLQMQRMDPATAEHVERAVREVLALAQSGTEKRGTPQFGCLRGKIQMAPDFDEPLAAANAPAIN